MDIFSFKNRDIWNYICSFLSIKDQMNLCVSGRCVSQCIKVDWNNGIYLMSDTDFLYKYIPSENPSNWSHFICNAIRSKNKSFIEFAIKSTSVNKIKYWNTIFSEDEIRDLFFYLNKYEKLNHNNICIFGELLIKSGELNLLKELILKNKSISDTNCIIIESILVHGDPKYFELIDDLTNSIDNYKLSSFHYYNATFDAYKYLLNTNNINLKNILIKHNVKINLDELINSEKFEEKLPTYVIVPLKNFYGHCETNITNQIFDELIYKLYKNPSDYNKYRLMYFIKYSLDNFRSQNSILQEVVLRFVINNYEGEDEGISLEFFKFIESEFKDNMRTAVIDSLSHIHRFYSRLCFTTISLNYLEEKYQAKVT